MKVLIIGLGALLLSGCGVFSEGVAPTRTTINCCCATACGERVPTRRMDPSVVMHPYGYRRLYLTIPGSRRDWSVSYELVGSSASYGTAVAMEPASLGVLRAHRTAAVTVPAGYALVILRLRPADDDLSVYERLSGRDFFVRYEGVHVPFQLRHRAAETVLYAWVTP